MLEARDRDYVQARVRAGLLEQNTVDLMRELGVAERLEREGARHAGMYLRRRGRTEYLDVVALTGRATTIYGQQEVVKDLIKAWLERGGEPHFEVRDVVLHDVDRDSPRVTYIRRRRQEPSMRLHRWLRWVSRSQSPLLPEGSAQGAQRRALGGLAGHPRRSGARHRRADLRLAPERFCAVLDALFEDQPPVHRGASGEDLDEWPDERVWAELQTRLAAQDWRVNEGPVIEKSITSMRSFVAEPMQHGRLFLAGDAAHIVPPTGAKGLNLAVNDVRLLAAALAEHYANGSDAALDSYTATALRRVWRAQEFSDEMLRLFHRLDGDPFDRACNWLASISWNVLRRPPAASPRTTWACRRRRTSEVSAGCRRGPRRRSIARAVSCTFGTKRSRSSSIPARLAWTETFSAATRPSASAIGTAADRRPSSSSSSTTE